MTNHRYPEPPDGEDVDVSGIAYLDRVGADLVAAAAAGAGQAAPSRRWARPALLSGVAAALAVVAFVGLQLGGSERMVEAIDIQQLEDRTIITVDELIDDPEEVRAELAAAGIAASIRGVLVPPSQVGALMTVGALVADDAVGSKVESDDRDGDGTVDVIVIPAGFGGTLEFGVGVSAEQDLGLEFAGAPAECDRLILRPLGDVFADIDELSDDITWLRQVDGEVTPVDLTDVPTTDTVIGLFAFPDGRLEVTTTDDVDRVMFVTPPCEM